MCFSLNFFKFSELCQFCSSAGVLPALCVYTHSHREKTESGKCIKMTDLIVILSHLEDIDHQSVLGCNDPWIGIHINLITKFRIRKPVCALKIEKEEKKKYFDKNLIIAIWSILYLIIYYYFFRRKTKLTLYHPSVLTSTSFLSPDT